jgi:hypothetical protein
MNRRSLKLRWEPYPGDVRFAAYLAAAAIVLFCIMIMLTLGAIAMRVRGLTVLAAVCIGLSGCGTIPIGNDQTGKSWAQAAIEIAKDPKCGHTDRIDIDLGIVSKGKIFLERACNAPLPEARADAVARSVEAAVAKAMDARFGPTPPN